MLESLRLRRTRIFAAYAVPVVVLACARPSLATDLGLDFWNLPALRETISSEERKFQELDHQLKTVLHNINVKEAIVESLVAGRIGLFDAATEFKAINQGRAEAASTLRWYFPAPTDDESVCLSVLSHVQVHAEHTPTARAVAIRIAAEFAAHRRGGAIKLRAIATGTRRVPTGLSEGATFD